MRISRIIGGGLGIAIIGGLGFFYYSAETVNGLIDLARPDAEISKEAVDTLYQNNREKLRAGYQKGTNPIAREYGNWGAAATTPANPGVHSGRYMMTFVNDLGLSTYTQYASQNVNMPIGTKIAKETFFVKGQGEFRRHPLFTMEKVGVENAPETDGWVYGRVNENGRQMPTSQAYCHSCHTGFKGQDFVGYPVKEARIGYSAPDFDDKTPPALVGEGDIERGKIAFQTCAACHNIGADATNAFGPVLTGVVGRDAGSYKDYSYSSDLQRAHDKGLVWDEQLVFEWLGNPSGFLRTYLDDESASSKMTIDFEDPQFRNDVIAYLKSVN